MGAMETDCEKCLHQKVCALWRAHESQDASCFSLDGCDYFDATLTPPNDPLTPEQLREMDGEPVYVVSAIGERPEWYIVDIEENEFKNPWDSISLENCDEGYPYTAYRRPPEGEED